MTGMRAKENITAQDSKSRRHGATLADMIEHSPSVSVISTGPDGLIDFWNKGAERIFGLTASEVIGKLMLHALFPEAGAEELHAAMCARAFRYGEPIHLELQGLTPASRSFWVRLSVSARTNGNGHVAGVMAVGEDITERKWAETKQAAIFAISAAVQSDQSPADLFQSIHQCISDILPAKNFYIALYDRERDLISFPYFVDECDPPPEPRKPGKGLTEYVLRTSAPLLASPERFRALAGEGEVESLGEPSVDWLGVPLRVGDQTLGVLVVQTYFEGTRYTDEDMQMLSFVSSQIAMAIDRTQKEASLRASEAELRGLFSAMNDVVILLDRQGRYLKIAPTNPGLLYKPSDQLIGRTIGQTFPPELADQFTGYIEEALSSGTPVKGGYSLPINGQDVWFDATISPAGENQVLLVARDSTARKQAEKSLRLLANTITCAKDCFVLSDLEGKILFVNEALLSTYGYNDQDLLGTEVTVLLSPETDPSVVRDMYATADAGWNGELMHRRKDGTDFPVELWISVVRSDSGEPIAHVGVARDIASRKRIEQAIRKSEERLRRITDNMLDMICQVDIQGICQYASPSIRKVLGFEIHKVVGKPLGRFIDRRDRPRVIRLLRDLARRPHSGKTAYRCRNASGATVWLESIINPLYDQGTTVSGFVIGSVDVTDRMKAEETLRLDESRLETLLRLNQMTGASMHQITDFALEEAVRLTKSKTGYLAFMNEDETILTMHAWSKSAMAECEVPNRPLVYPVASTGLWGEPVRQRKPVIINDYEKPNPMKRGLPRGHVSIMRHMGIPVFDGERIVAVAGVGNKEEDYSNSDVRQLTLLMEGMWLLLQRQRSDEKIRKSLEEKEVLLKEIHHRVKNNLQIISSLLNLQSGQVKDRHLLELLRESQNRIRSMALIHERLYRSEDFSRVDFGQYVNGLTTYLVRSYATASRSINLHVDVQDVSLGVDVAIPCGLIINELVSNCLKHAFPDGRQGEMTVALRREGEAHLLRVEDNGAGLPGNIDLKKAESLGLQLVETLTTQIGGSIDVRTSPGEGTAFTISFRAC